MKTNKIEQVKLTKTDVISAANVIRNQFEPAGLSEVLFSYVENILDLDKSGEFLRLINLWLTCEKAIWTPSKDENAAVMNQIVMAASDNTMNKLNAFIDLACGNSQRNDGRATLMSRFLPRLYRMYFK